MREDLPCPSSDAHFKSERAVTVARRLRRAMTRAELALWAELRRVPLKGTHFRRQAPFGPYIADFLCHGARLVIEIDGGAHEGRERDDAERQAWIRSRGYKVVRFTNAEVAQDVGRVVRAIVAELNARRAKDDGGAPTGANTAVTPTPNPAPQGGGGR